MRTDCTSIEENKETVDKKDIEELETQISIECIKVYNYLLEIETFEADGKVCIVCTISFERLEASP